MGNGEEATTPGVQLSGGGPSSLLPTVPGAPCASAPYKPHPCQVGAPATRPWQGRPELLPLQGAMQIKGGAARLKEGTQTALCARSEAPLGSPSADSLLLVISIPAGGTINRLRLGTGPATFQALPETNPTWAHHPLATSVGGATSENLLSTEHA